MSERVDVRSFEAVASFRAAVVRFVETANAAMSSAEVEIGRTVSWLETEQLPHWKAMLRSTADELEKAKAAYREKRFYKDASGARSSAIDELKALRKVEAKRAEVEKRAKATGRNLRQLQRELTLYHGSAHQLRGVVNGTLPQAVDELGRVVEQLERYVRAAPEPSRAREPGHMAKNPSHPPEQEADEAAEAAVIEMLRRRTPTSRQRASAQRADFVPALPAVQDDAIAALAPRLAPQPPGKYQIVTTTLSASGQPADLYLERCQPAAEGDSGWHIGSAAQEPDAGACVTITVGRLASQQPRLARLLALPVGSVLRASDGRLLLAADALGRTLWRSGRPMQGDH